MPSIPVVVPVVVAFFHLRSQLDALLRCEHLGGIRESLQYSFRGLVGEAQPLDAYRVELGAVDGICDEDVVKLTMGTLVRTGQRLHVHGCGLQDRGDLRLLLGRSVHVL